MSAGLRAWSAGAVRRVLGKVGVNADPVIPERNKHEKRDAAFMRNEALLLDGQLNLLRHQLERKTQHLNDCSFEVTEEWLFEFASLHAEYTEKASSNRSQSHEFRSTTDLLHHVLQHPRVLCMFARWGEVDSKAAASFVENQVDSPDMQCDRMDIMQEPPEEAALFVTEASANSSSNGFVAQQSTACIESHQTDNLDFSSVKNRIHRVECTSKIESGTTLQRHLSAPGDFSLAKKQVRSLQPGRRLSAPGVNPQCEDGELIQKLRQRASRKSWQGLSPRSMRLAQSAPVDVTCAVADTMETPGKLAARRKLLENKLKTCGFDKRASSGGA